MDILGRELFYYLGIATVLPLFGFAYEIFAGYGKNPQLRKHAAYVAIACIGTGFVLSSLAFCRWNSETEAFDQFKHADEQHQVEGHALVADEGHEPGHDKHAAGHEKHAEGGHAGSDEHHGDHSTAVAAVSGNFYTLAVFGDLEITIDYYIDSLTLLMFCMVTFIATCIHVFAVGYMSDELVEE